jgi:hypothetical protein
LRGFISCSRLQGRAIPFNSLSIPLCLSHLPPDTTPFFSLHHIFYSHQQTTTASAMAITEVKTLAQALSKEYHSANPDLTKCGQYLAQLKVSQQLPRHYFAGRVYSL